MAAGKNTDHNRLSLEVNGKTFQCRLNPNPNNRHIRLRVLPEYVAEEGMAAWIRFPGLTVDAPTSEWLPGLLPEAQFCIAASFPPWVPRQQVILTIQTNAEWILAQTQRHPHVHTAALNPLGPGAKLWYRGQYLKLLVFPSQKSRVKIERVGTQLYCSLPGGSTALLTRYLEKWYRQETMRLVTKKLPGLAETISGKPYTVKVRSHRNRWGSCSEEGRLSFNWKLSMMPDLVWEYVLIHELVHLEEFNHSRAFWERIQQHCPGYKDAKRWLKHNTRWLNG
jgi:predicted metal-dependent hydrolase